MTDLTDAEFAELDGLLAEPPPGFEPLDAVALDGYLCGVLVQPVLVAAAEWMPVIFGDDAAAALEAQRDTPWVARCLQLIERRHAALNRAIGEDAAFDPLILEPDPDADDAAEAGQDLPEELAQLAPVSRALAPWVAGFDLALQTFPALVELPDDAVVNTLMRLLRHLPAETDEERDLIALMDEELPLATLEEAVDDLVASVAELWDLTREQRYRVETVRRDTPKVGRNDPCPCGSGRKFKHCHGAS